MDFFVVPRVVFFVFLVVARAAGGRWRYSKSYIFKPPKSLKWLLWILGCTPYPEINKKPKKAVEKWWQRVGDKAFPLLSDGSWSLVFVWNSQGLAARDTPDHGVKKQSKKKKSG